MLGHFTVIFMFHGFMRYPFNTIMYPVLVTKIPSQLAWYVLFTDIDISPKPTQHWKWGNK